MNFTARGLLTLILTVAIAAQAIFVQATGARAADPATQSSDAERIARLETLLESLRQELKIPAYSAAIVKDQKVLWAKGFGYADVQFENPDLGATTQSLGVVG